MSEEVVLKLTIDDKEFDVKIAADSKAIEALRKQFEKTSKGTSNSISGLKKNLGQLIDKFEEAEIGSEEFKKLKTEVEKARTAIKKAEKNVEDLEKPSKSVLEVFSQWGNVVTGLNQALEIVKKIYSVVSKPINVAGEFEKYEVQFEVLLGGVREAKARIGELSTFAAKTPFQFPEIIRASKQLEVLTQGALSTGEGLRMLGDVSAGVGVPIDELSMWFGRLYDGIQSGRPVGEAMMRLQELGVMSGKARSEVEDLMDANVDSKEVWKAVTGEMSRYDGMMEKQSKTYEGMVSNLEDSITLLQRSVGNNLLPLAKDMVSFMSAVVESFTPLEEVITNFGLATEEASNQRNEFIRLTNQYELLATNINKTDAEQELYKETIDDLQRLYPDYLTNINLEKSSIDDVRDAFMGARLELEKYLEKMILKGVLQDKEKELVEIGKAIWEGEKKRIEVEAAYKSALETKQLFGVKYETDEDVKNAIELHKKSATNFVDSVNKEMVSKKAELKETIKKITEEVGEIINSDDGKKGNDDKELTNKQIKSQLELHKLRHELDELSTEDFRRYLENRVANLKSGTAEEKKVLLAYKKELEKLEKGITKDAFDKNKKELELNRLQKDLLQTSLEDYKTYLENRIKSLKSGTAEEKKILLQFQKELNKTNKELAKKDTDEYKLDRLEADTETDKYRREEKLLDIWKDKELEKWADNEKAKANIEKIYSNKRQEIAIAERDAKIGTVMDTLGSMSSMFAEHTVAYKALAVAQATWNTYQAATAALGAQPWGPWNIAQAALVTAKGIMAVDKIINTEAPQTPGLAEGGRLKKGEHGFIEGWHDEIVAPEDTFIDIFKNELRPKIYDNLEKYQQSDLINKAVAAVEHKMMAINVQSSTGDNLLFVAKLDEFNANLKQYLENPIPPVMTKDAIGKIWRDGRKMSKGYRG